MLEKEVKQNYSKKKSKKRKLTLKAKFLLSIIIIALIWWFNNFTIKITDSTIYSDKIANPMTITLISDYHAEEYGIQPETILNKLKDIDTDIVFYIGDMYSRNTNEKEIQMAIDVMIGTVNLGYKTYFVTGEHDNNSNYFRNLSDGGVNIMHYDTDLINVNGNNVQILGINNVYFSDTFRLSKDLTLDPNAYSILMAHIPMYEQYKEFGADLTICGDTHGGMIQIPFDRGPVYYTTDGRWCAELFERQEDVYDKGLFNFFDNYKYMYITSGIGNFPVPARLNNRPEIVMLDILPIDN